MDSVQLYTDGSSFNGDVTSWAYAIIRNGEVSHSNSGLLFGDICQMYQVGGEIMGVVEGVTYCYNNNMFASVFVDYIGLIYWVSDIFDAKKWPWKRKNKWSQFYRSEIIRLKDSIDQIYKVDAHSGNQWNELVDKIAKEAISTYQLKNKLT